MDKEQRSAKSIAEARVAVQSAAPSLALMRQGFTYQYQGMQTNWSKEQISPYSLSAPIPQFVRIRGLMRLFSVEALVLEAEGKHAAAMSSSLDAIRFSQDVGQGPTLIAGMIGVLGQGIGGKEALLHIDRLTATEARQAIPRMAQLVQNEPAMAPMIEGERLVSNGAFKEMMVPGASGLMGLATGLSYSNDFWNTAGFMILHNASVFWYTNQGIVDAYNHYMDRVIQQASLPYQQARLPSKEHQKALPPITEMMIPNFERARLSTTKTAARNRVILTRLAVQAYRQEHNGVSPKTLNDLTLGSAPYLITVPSDPFSQTGNDPLRYANGSAYSVGENGKDDSGQGDDRLE